MSKRNRRNKRRRDSAAQVATNRAAPADERREAELAAAKAGAGGDSVLGPGELAKAVSFIKDQTAEAQFMKSRSGVKIPMQKSRSRGMQSVWVDDMRLWARAEYWDKPGPMGFDMLRQMVGQTPVLNAVIMTRIRQISRFCRPRENHDSPGFVVRHVDSEHQESREEAESLRLLMRFMNNSGWEFSPWKRKRLRRPTLTQFMAQSVRDSLTMDAAPIETEMKRDRELGLDGFYAVDGATIRLCSEHGYRGDDEIFAAQVIDGRVRTLYRYEDLIYEPRNPRTNVELGGYGMGETELLVRVVTGLLNAMTYNIKGFTDNAIPKGVLHLTGEYDTEDLNAFKRYWNAMVRGIDNSWTVPVLTAGDPEAKASFERFGVEYDEMYFSKWMTFLTSIICAIYAMTPDEINFESFTSGRAPLSGSDTEEKLESSIDKGLRPLLAYYESIFSDYVLGSFSDKYVFRFTGLDTDSAEHRFELRKSVATVDEIRAQEGMDAWPGEDGIGDAPLNPSLLSAWQQAQQGDEQEDFGQEQLGGEGAPEQDGQPGEAPGGAQADAEQTGGGADEPKPKGDFGEPQGAGQKGDFGKSLRIYTIE
jgi:hypothetical protein